jgi:hypothetical protein
MYEVDELDLVVELANAPKPDVGAPLPHLICAESRLVLAYLVSEPDPSWDGSNTTLVGPDSEGQPIAIVQFQWPYAHMFGPPNDEAFAGHPLAKRGLRPYAAWEVQQSSWLRQLERMNSVHPHHDKNRFLSERRHFVIVFHDSTFECIAEGFAVEVLRGSLRSVMPRMLELLA